VTVRRTLLAPVLRCAVVRVDIGGGVRLFVDVDGFGWVADAGALRRRPTVLLLHGGPGMDHSSFKTSVLAELRDVAQVVVYDHRSQGRSDDRPPEEWDLDVWADDVVRLCDALGIERPVVLGNSFGGFVAQRYAARHPDHPARLILSSTAARLDATLSVQWFWRLGGEDAAVAAAAFLAGPTPEEMGRYLRVCGPLYTRRAGNPLDSAMTVRRDDVSRWFFSGPHLAMDLRPDLARIACPVLVLAGEQDPICPIELAEELAAGLPPALVRFERFPDAGHGVYRDEPERALAVVREFVLGS
jgi:proline iminopeptidase